MRAIRGAYRLWCVALEGARLVGGYLPLLLLRKDLGEKGRIISKVFEDTTSLGELALSPFEEL